MTFWYFMTRPLLKFLFIFTPPEAAINGVQIKSDDPWGKTGYLQKSG